MIIVHLMKKKIVIENNCLHASWKLIGKNDGKNYLEND